MRLCKNGNYVKIELLLMRIYKNRNYLKIEYLLISNEMKVSDLQSDKTDIKEGYCMGYE